MILKLWIPQTFAGWFYLIFKWKTFTLYKEEVEDDLKRAKRRIVSLNTMINEYHKKARENKQKIEQLEYELRKAHTRV